jgi:Cu(I)/Ag(I) efflux system membrane fusion protein
MTSSSLLKAAALTVLGASLAAGGYLAGTRHATTSTPTTAAAPATSGDKIDPKTGRKVLYWHDPMAPGQKFDKPGKSPYMDMELVPVYADDAAAAGGVTITPTMQQNLGIRYATVRRAAVGSTLTVVGSTQFDESLADVVQSRVTGYIERLHARTPMQRIQRGAPVATLFVPDWLAPQEEYLALKRSGNTELADAARQRMRALSIPDALIAQLDKTGQVQRQLTLTSPASGVVTELAVREGAMVSPGMTIAKVAGLHKLWLLAEVPETLVPVVQPGMRATAQFAGRPERRYTGVVRDLLPQVSTATRTVQARLELDNRDGSLTPGLLMQVQLAEAAPASRLLVPTEAVIQSGRRSVVLVAGENNSVKPVTVMTGREHGDDIEVLEGLSEGQRVVASGQFLIDSEASLKSALTKFSTATTSEAPTTAAPGGSSAAPPPPHAGHDAHAGHGTATKAVAAPLHQATGKIEQVTPEALTLSHSAVPELKWGAMTMDFSKPRPDAFKQFKRGDQVRFTFRETDDGYLLESVEPATGSKR